MDITDKLASLPFITVLAIAVALCAAKVLMGRSRHIGRQPMLTAYQALDSILFAWVAVMVIVTPCFGQAFYIPSESMEPTLNIHDRLTVVRPPFWLRGPRRGEVLVFNAPPNADKHGGKFPYIKRVIGLPGEKLEVRAGRVFINDLPLVEPYTMAPSANDFGPIVVPEHHVFMMGDNRNNSADSRYWGPLDEDRIIGKAAFRFWPLEAIGPQFTPAYPGVPEKAQPALGAGFVLRRYGIVK
jgi:signal peptidase I